MIFLFKVLLGPFFPFSFFLSSFIWNGAFGNTDIDFFTLDHLEANESRMTALSQSFESFYFSSTRNFGAFETNMGVRTSYCRLIYYIHW